jgi:DNA gyrase inhibitor GyrI
MSVVTSQATSSNPEQDAWRKLAAWAKPAGLLADLDAHPVFGFNNPPPEPDDPIYGYEYWIQVPASLPDVAGLGRQEFSGGRYAVARCRLLDDPNGSVPEVWQRLLKWTEDQGYRWRMTHELERLVNPNAPPEQIELELYLPIEEE